MDSNHRIGQIINIALALLLLLGIALTVYAINRVRTLKSEAATTATKTSSNYSLSVSPNPVPANVNTAITFTGSGYKPNERVWITIGGIACCGGTKADSKGSFTYTSYAVVGPGSNTASVLVRQNNSWVWAVNATFSAQ